MMTKWFGENDHTESNRVKIQSPKVLGGAIVYAVRTPPRLAQDMWCLVDADGNELPLFAGRQWKHLRDVRLAIKDAARKG